MKILLTGASGFLGRIIKSTLKDHDIYTLSRAGSDATADLSYEVPILPYVEAVIHAAGKAHSVPKTEEEKQLFFDVNLTGTANLLKGLEKAGKLPAYFVFISSVAVYGLETATMVLEQTPLLAEDAYGKSKVEAEKLVQDWCNKNNVICTILRLPLLAGANPPGNLGAMVKGIQKGYYFNIAGGRAKKSIVIAEDVAKAIPAAAKIGGTYNLTDRHHPNFFELSKNIARQLHKNTPYNIPLAVAKIIALMGDLLGDNAPLNTQKLKKITSDLTFDDSKAVQAFGWSPTPVLEGLRIS